ncbi:MAG: glycosyltransferase family 2 protein [Nodosilinea sp.]
MMQLSVVVPCFNAAETLAQQLNALTQQTLAPWEVIVADNGSTDDSLSIAAQYVNRLPNLKIVDASDRRGASHARNTGAQAATGNALAFCDADDVVSSTWVEALTEALSEHGFVASRFEFRLLNGPDAEGGFQEDGLQNFKPPVFPYAGGCGLAIPRQLHEAVEGFDESVQTLEDTDYCMRVQIAGTSLHFVPEAVVHVRFHQGANDAFWQALSWGESFTTIYTRYREHGVRCYGILPRLVAIMLSFMRCLITRFEDGAVWRLGWHLGLLRGFVKLRLASLTTGQTASNTV